MAPKRRKKRKVKRRRTAAPRVQVPRVCDAALSALLAQGGESRTSLELTLGEAVKRLWAHAKANGLQDGREIRCDAAMRELFDTRRLGMFEVSGALSAHMRGSSVAASASSSSSSSSTAVARSAESARLVTLSPALTSLLCGSDDGRGGGGRQLTLAHGEVVRLLGKYIVRRGLHVPRAVCHPPHVLTAAACGHPCAAPTSAPRNGWTISRTSASSAVISVLR